jgi:large repetitive protein
VVNTFTATTPTNSLNIPITAFTASDNVAVTGYMITTSSSAPTSGSAGWAAGATTTYTVASAGTYTLYPWARDAAGNVSAVFGSPRTVVVDTTRPVVNTFTAKTPSSSLSIPITAFTASDNLAVTGYKITTSATAPTAGSAGWTASAPVAFSVAATGTYTLYPWAKDASGNVSLVFGSPRTVVVQTIKSLFLPLVIR